MDVKLKVVGGRQAGNELSLPDGNFLIGRAEDCQMRPGSEMISRHHCAITVEDAYVGLRDFGSKNGTFLNDVRIAGEQELKSGDRLRIGPLEFEISIDLRVGGKRRPAVKDVAEVATRTAKSAFAETKDDISDWLDESESTPAEAMRETHTLHSGDTDVIDVDQPATTEDASDSPQPSEEEPEKETGKKKRAKGKDKKKKPGKLPTMHRDLSADSTSAAADVLRRMSGRR